MTTSELSKDKPLNYYVVKTLMYTSCLSNITFLRDIP